MNSERGELKLSSELLILKLSSLPEVRWE